MKWWWTGRVNLSKQGNLLLKFPEVANVIIIIIISFLFRTVSFSNRPYIMPSRQNLLSMIAIQKLYSPFLLFLKL